MLVEKSNTPGKTKYICDMCRERIKENPRKIYTGNTTTAVKKKWDLCEKDYQILQKNINNWYLRLEKKKEA